MRLAFAPGSGFYRIDEEGRIYTAHYYRPGQIPPGERPTGREQQYSGGTAYWLPTGQVEELTDEQLDELFPEDEAVGGWDLEDRRDCGVSPCFVDCGEPACRELGCVRVYNARMANA